MAVRSISPELKERNMPYPNEHAARLKDPGKYKRFTRTNDKFGSGVHAIWGWLDKDGKETSELQAIRFDVKKFTVKAAKAWLKGHDYKPILFEPATKAGANSFILPFKSDGATFLCAGDDEKVPSKLFRKEVIKVGHWIKDADDIEFNVTPEILHHWEETFGLFLANGIKVPIPTSHFGTENKGYVRGLVIEGDSLFSVVEIFGEDADVIAATNDVSIFSPPEWVDGAGNIYNYPILHIALTPYPVIPGLKGFEAIAASILTYKEIKKMDWKKVQEALGIAEELNEDNAEELILSMAKANDEAAKELKELQKKVTKLESEKQALVLSQDGKKPEPYVIKLAAESVTGKFDGLVQSQKISPVVRDKLVSVFIGDDLGALTLSLSQGNTSICDGVVEALKENDVVKLGEQTKAQSLTLEDPTKSGSKESPVVADARARAEAAK